MIRIVVDTNFLGPRGHLNFRSLKKLRDEIDSANASIVVPEVVLWEWAEHAHDALSKSKSVHDKERRRYDYLEILPDFELPTVQQLVERVEDALLSEQETLSVDDGSVGDVTPITIAAHESVDALEALRAQVLLLSPTERRNDVKTGAADYLVFCTTERELRGNPLDKTVLATDDRKLADFCASNLEGLVVVRNLAELVPIVLDSISDEEHRFESAFFAAVQMTIADKDSVFMSDLREATAISTRRDDSPLPSHDTYVEYQLSSPRNVEVASFILLGRRRSVAVATLSLDADVNISDLDIIQIGPDEFDRQVGPPTAVSIGLQVPVLAHIGTAAEVRSISLGGTVAVTGPSSSEAG